MTQFEIRNRKEELEKQISVTSIALGELRRECKHPNKTECNYMWRVGSTCLATICDDCGEVLKTYLYKPNEHGRR